MEVVQGDKYSRQNQHQPQHQNQLSHNVVDKSPYFEKPCFGRGLFKVSLETSPLQRIQAPPCHIRSIAVSSSDNHDGCASVYLGTDSGDIYFFTWHRLVSPADCSAANSIPDSPKKENNHTDLKLVLSKSLGLSPVDFLCLLPRIGAIAVLLDKQVVILDCVSLDILECLLTSKGAFTLARAVGSSELSNGRIVRGSIDTAGESRGLPQTPRRTGGHGHLGRLFGSGRLSARRGVPAISVGESANMQSVQSILQSKEHTLSITEESLSHEEVIGYDSGVESFAVAVKQKLLLFTVKKRSRVLRSSNIANEAISISLKEMVGPEEVVTMAWIENAIITGNYQEYMLFSLVDGQASLIFSLPEGLVSPPLLKVFPKEPEVLLLMDNVGVAVNAAGHPTSSSLVFREIPDAVGQSAAYAVIVRRGVVELYHRKTGAKVQSISLSDTNWGPNIIAEDEDGKFLILASAFKVSFLERVPLDDQLKELLRHKQFDEAVALAEECSSEMDTDIAREKLANVHAQAGFLQFFDLHFKEAVDHFLQSSVMNPAEFFPFFPGATDQWRALVPRTRYWGLHPPPQPIHNVIESKLRAVQRGLILHSVSDMGDLPNSQKAHLIPTSSRSKSSIIHDCTLEAIAQVIRYLRAARDKPMPLPLKEGVDTLLMHLLARLDATDDMEAFAASENSCVVEELEDMLRQSGRLSTLAFLYETKGMLEKALQVWKFMAGNMDADIPSSARRIHKIRNSDQDEKLDFQLSAAKEASRLLEASSDEVLVLTHIKWVLKVSQDIAITILSSGKREKPISPEVVLAELDPNEVYVRQRYLEWLIQEKAEENSHYHTMLAVSLAKSAMESLVNDSAIGDMNDARMLSNDSSSSNRQRLRAFLESSDKYDPTTVLALILDSDFWREQAILHRKLGDEIRVFQILALKLGDIEAAEQYCMELGRPDAYMRLLNMYLKPSDGREPMYGAAVHLLELHGTSLDRLQVLEALSLDMPLQLAYETIARMFRSGVHKHRQGQISKHLMRAENFEARLSRLEQRSRHVSITDETFCGSCLTKFGTKLFAFYPNDSAVCYKCFRNSGSTVDPVTGCNFEKGVDPIYKD